MSHTDLHAKTENLAKQKPASPTTYNNLSTKGPAAPSTPNATQSTEETPRLATCWKSALGRSHIYERLYPDGITATLRIDGPGDSFFALGNQGTIHIVSGRYSKQIGAGSGKLNVRTYGGQMQKHEGRSNFEYSAGDDSEKCAVNIIAYGDVTEDAKGSQRTIKASKIFISAATELYLAGQSIVLAASNGTGNIQMFAGNVEQTTANKKDTVVGQVMKFGVSEESTIQFDPRASVNWVSPGHVNWKILGDCSTWIGGSEQHIVAGGTPVPPLNKVRDSAYTVKTAVGGQIFDAADFINRKAGGAMADNVGGAYDVKAGGAFNADVGGAYAIKAGAAFSANAGGNASMAAGGTASVTAAGEVNIIGVGNVNIKGALIFLN
jgi:hypothetical protein